MKQLKVSVIVYIYNDPTYQVKKTVESVLGQRYPSVELVIVNSGKKIKLDNIREIWTKPKGIANAMNVGIENSQGDYLFFLGAGDGFVNNKVVANMMNGVDGDRDWLVVGQINRITVGGNILYTTKNIFKKWQLLYKMAIPHQGLFMSKKYFEKYGLFDEGCKYAMDYELLLRAYKSFPKVIQKNMVVANWVEGGVGQNDTDQVLTEYHRIRIKNKIAPRWILELIHKLSRLRYGYK